MNTLPSLSQEELGHAVQKLDDLAAAMNQVLFGKEDLIELTLIGVLARGHILLEGLPGLGKTELVKGLSRALDLTARRVQSHLFIQESRRITPAEKTPPEPPPSPRRQK